MPSSALVGWHTPFETEALRRLRQRELEREADQQPHRQTMDLKLRWRAQIVRRRLQVLPGESILEFGAGGGAWTRHLESVHRGENSITAMTFNPHFAEIASENTSSKTRVVVASDLNGAFPPSSFDHIVGDSILCRGHAEEIFAALYRWLKPGGQFLLFEPNSDEARITSDAERAGFSEVRLTPTEILPDWAPAPVVSCLTGKVCALEHIPKLQQLCRFLTIFGRKAGGERKSRVSLADHPQLFDSVSVVIPCRNEAPNIPRLVTGLKDLYDPYVHEIIIVNDNSTDRTADVTLEIGAAEPKVKLINRKPPNGVGLALSDGYRVASGRYILSMDCDFFPILHELRDLFDAIAAGRDGAIGSRFSCETLLIDYPPLKLLCNRGFHFFLKLIVPFYIRDVTNNLKLYRAEILKNLNIDSRHFGANLETGLRPRLAGYDIREVPTSWINRTADMGLSTFKLLQVGREYIVAAIRALLLVRQY
jgi:dolichol-phosphate mannosyltransferase